MRKEKGERKGERRRIDDRKGIKEKFILYHFSTLLYFYYLCEHLI